MEKKDNTVKWAGLVAAFVIVVGALVIFASNYGEQVKGVTASLPEIAKKGGNIEVFAGSDIDWVIKNLEYFLANPTAQNLDAIQESLEILRR